MLLNQRRNVLHMDPNAATVTKRTIGQSVAGVVKAVATELRAEAAAPTEEVNAISDHDATKTVHGNETRQ